ncbi:hypothetical protein LINPERHAP2_LOCUS4498 [Linum perenne]
MLQNRTYNICFAMRLSSFHRTVSLIPHFRLRLLPAGCRSCVWEKRVPTLFTPSSSSAAIVLVLYSR